jgi:cell division protein FtsB
VGVDFCEDSAEMNHVLWTKKKGLIILVIGLIVIVWYFILFGGKGVIRIIQLEQERHRIVREGNLIKNENRNLKEEIRRLREDPKYLESVARRDLGLIKENEILFIFEDEGVEE